MSCVTLGNTILVVEHDPDVIAAADYLIDLGRAPESLEGGCSPAAPSPR